jgi:predicted small secreted protein
MKFSRKFILLCALFTSLVLLTGCNTVQGLGKDVQKGGQTIQKAASK